MDKDLSLEHKRVLADLFKVQEDGPFTRRYEGPVAEKDIVETVSVETNRNGRKEVRRDFAHPTGRTETLYYDVQTGRERNSIRKRRKRS